MYDTSHDIIMFINNCKQTQFKLDVEVTKAFRKLWHENVFLQCPELGILFEGNSSLLYFQLVWLCNETESGYFLVIIHVWL